MGTYNLQSRNINERPREYRAYEHAYCNFVSGIVVREDMDHAELLPSNPIGSEAWYAHGAFLQLLEDIHNKYPDDDPKTKFTIRVIDTETGPVRVYDCGFQRPGHRKPLCSVLRYMGRGPDRQYRDENLTNCGGWTTFYSRVDRMNAMLMENPSILNDRATIDELKVKYGHGFIEAYADCLKILKEYDGRNFGEERPEVPGYEFVRAIFRKVLARRYWYELREIDRYWFNIKQFSRRFRDNIVIVNLTNGELEFMPERPLTLTKKKKKEKEQRVIIGSRLWAVIRPIVAKNKIADDLIETVYSRSRQDELKIDMISAEAYRVYGRNIRLKLVGSADAVMTYNDHLVGLIHEPSNEKYWRSNMFTAGVRVCSE